MRTVKLQQNHVSEVPPKIIYSSNNWSSPSIGNVIGKTMYIDQIKKTEPKKKLLLTIILDNLLNKYVKRRGVEILLMTWHRIYNRRHTITQKIFCYIVVQSQDISAVEIGKKIMEVEVSC